MAASNLTTVALRREYAKAFMQDFRGNIPDKSTLILEDIRMFAMSLGWQSLSETYQGADAKLQFICQNKHSFSTSRTSLLTGSWCPQCVGRGKKLEDLQRLAANFGGECLSVVYEGMRTKHLWRCSEGHQWEAVPTAIQSQGVWCPVCGIVKRARGRRQHTIKDIQSLAREHEGECLSEVFVSMAKNLLWRCVNKHTWEATPNDIRRGRWCQLCRRKEAAEKRKKYTIEDMQKLAVTKSGKCLSKELMNLHAHLRWECAAGHQWDARPANILFLDRWCPECKIGIGQRICQAFFEQIFNTSFKTARPRWLRTLEGRQMELDGYAPSLKIAFEHQGMQHFQYNPHFHDHSEEKFLHTKERDERKKELCRQHGIILIIVPSILEIIGISHVKETIQEKLLEANVPLPGDFDTKTITLEMIYRQHALLSSERQLDLWSS